MRWFLLQKKWRFILILAVAIGALPFLLPRDIVFHSKKSVGIDKTINHRIDLWKEAINIIKAKPLFGCGLNTYVLNIEKYNPGNRGEVKDYYAHNGYLQHAAETGVFGLMTLLSLLGRYTKLLFQCGYKNAPSRNFFSIMLFLSVFSFLFYMFFDTIFHNLQPFLLFWLMLGWSTVRFEREGQINE